jgi:hypothetical protein
MTTTSAESAAAALARNDRYVRKFVEALNLCPYARRCRETGKLHRRVLGSPGEALAAIAELEALPPESVEVALLIFPEAEVGSLEAARAFEAFCAEVRDGMARAHGGGEPPFFCVAFHPDLALDTADANRAVHFIRRSPDPTLQLVRASVLRAVRGTRTGGSTFVDASRLTLDQLLAVAAPLGVSERIAEANFETLQREGPARLAAELEAIRASGRG